MLGRWHAWNLLNLYLLLAFFGTRLSKNICCIHLYLGSPNHPAVLNGRGLVLEGSNPKIKDKRLPGTYIYIYTYIRKSHILYRCVSLFHYQSKNQFLTFSFKGPPRTKCSFSTNITGVKEVGKPSGPNRPCQWWTNSRNWFPRVLSISGWLMWCDLTNVWLYDSAMEHKNLKGLLFVSWFWLRYVDLPRWNLGNSRVWMVVSPSESAVCN